MKFPGKAIMREGSICDIVEVVEKFWRDTPRGFVSIDTREIFKKGNKINWPNCDDKCFHHDWNTLDDVMTRLFDADTSGYSVMVAWLRPGALFPSLEITLERFV